MRLLLLIGIMISSVTSSFGQYLIEGKMTNPDTQMVAYLNILNRWDEFNYIAEYMILKATRIQPDGSFRFEGNELAEETGFYKIHFSDPAYTAVYRTGDPEAKNYFHFLLSNHDTIAVEVTGATHAPGGVHIQSTLPENEQIIAYTAHTYQLLAQEKESSMPHYQQLIDQKRAAFAQEKLVGEQHGLVGMFLLHLGNLDIESHPEAFDQVFSQLANTDVRQVYHETLLEHIGSKRYADLLAENKNLRVLIWGASIFILALLLSLGWQQKHMKGLRKTESEAFNPTDKLTSKEEEVALLIGQRLTNKEIAAKLHISEATVKTHVNSIYRKTPFSNRRELQQGFQNGFSRD